MSERGSEAEFPRFLAPLPGEIQDEVDRAAIVGGSLFEAGDWDAAFRLFRDLNRRMEASQPQGKRFHKGMPLHNMGLARVLGGNFTAAFKFTLGAFTEDALSAGDERLPEGEEFRRPAAANLLSAFGVQLPELQELASTLRSIGARELFRTPTAALKSIGVRATLRRPPTPRAAQPRKVGQFTSDWQDRVFVGGAYKLFANMNQIKKIVRRRGFDAVMASDFDIPRELNHHHALMLLHECRLAIFEISIEAGQLMELERTRDYEIDPRDILVLVIAASGRTADISGMPEALLGKLGIAPTTYEDIDDLPGIIEPWLASRGAASP